MLLVHLKGENTVVGMCNIDVKARLIFKSLIVAPFIVLNSDVHTTLLLFEGEGIWTEICVF